ncbi:MAG: hypothetical protein IKZ91_03910 [Bacteroidales bacterium]|nr:hypothetical protein [Bacteroidales bacterium]
MKKLTITIVLFFVGLLAFDSCANGWGRKDVFISYDQLGTDAAYKQFRKANKQNQAEILVNLVDQAEKEYRQCESIDDLYEVKENLEIIKFWINRADQKFIAITKRIRTLDRNIDDTIAEVKKQTVIQVQGSNTGYSGWGQELD